MYDYFDEIENKAFQKKVLNKIAETDKEANVSSNKLCIDIMYKTCQSLTTYNQLISVKNIWEPIELIGTSVNLSPFLLFGLFKRGLITEPTVYSCCEVLYNKFKNFHMELGEESFTHFICYVCIGYTRADKYYSEHIETIMENQIKDLEKEFNND